MSHGFLGRRPKPCTNRPHLQPLHVRSRQLRTRSAGAIYEGRASIYEGRALNRGPTRSAYGDLAERVVAVSIKCEVELGGGTGGQRGALSFSGGRTRSIAILSDRWDENEAANWVSANA